MSVVRRVSLSLEAVVVYYCTLDLILQPRQSPLLNTSQEDTNEMVKRVGGVKGWAIAIGLFPNKVHSTRTRISSQEHNINTATRVAHCGLGAPKRTRPFLAFTPLHSRVEQLLFIRTYG